MGLRFRKSINLGGGFRVNLSKSGIGYSWGTKGYRITKTASGKTRKTYSIPGTGISYVDEKGKSNLTAAITKNDNIYTEYMDNNQDSEGGLVMVNILKTILKIIGGIILFSILLVYFPAALILGGIATIIYFITHRQVFAEKSLIKKIGTSILLFFIILFGATGTFGEPAESNSDKQSNAPLTVQEEPAKEEINNSNSNTQSITSVPENSTTSETPDTNQAPATEQPTNTETTTVEQAPTAVATVVTETPEVSETAPKEILVYLPAKGEKYHKESCRTLKDTKTEVTLDEAIAAGYEPCKVCHPPVK